MTTLSEALTAYRICARAEGRSRRTIEWITSSVGYFNDFLGQDQDISTVTADHLRRFIIALRERGKYSQHPYSKPQRSKLSPQSIETYCRGIRVFYGYLYREGFIDVKPLEKMRMPKVPKKTVPTFSEKEIQRLLSQPARGSNEGFRDYVLMLVLLDTGIRVGELAGLRESDVDLENGYLRVMGKGGRERHVPFGQKVAKGLLKYRLKHRCQPIANDSFFLTRDGRPLTSGRIQKLVPRYGERAGLKRCYCHKLRHTSAVMYLRNGGDPFSLQKKLGHASLHMTRHYANLADSDVRSAHLKHSPVDRLGF